MGELISDAFTYPLRGHGVGLILLFAAFFGFVDLLSRSWRNGLFFSIFGAGYLSAFLFQIVAASATGKRELPAWPEFTDIWDSIAIPFFQMAAPWVVCLAPAALPFAFLGLTPGSLTAAVIVAIVTSFYLPMAILSIALNSSVAAMHPAVVFPAIKAVLGPYLVVWGMLTLVGAISMVIQILVARTIPFVGFAINAVVSLFLLSVEMRLLGLVYFAYPDRLKLV